MNHRVLYWVGCDVIGHVSRLSLSLTHYETAYMKCTLSNDTCDCCCSLFIHSVINWRWHGWFSSRVPCNICVYIYIISQQKSLTWTLQGIYIYLLYILVFSCLFQKYTFLCHNIYINIYFICIIIIIII